VSIKFNAPARHNIGYFGGAEAVQRSVSLYSYVKLLCYFLGYAGSEFVEAGSTLLTSVLQEMFVAVWLHMSACGRSRISRYSK